MLPRLPRLAVVFALATSGLLLSRPAFGAISGSTALEAIRLAGEPRPESIVGLGVDTATGAQTLARVELPFDAGQPISVTLRYDSNFAGTTGPLGRGWRHDFQATIAVDANDRVTVSWGGHFQNTYRFVDLFNGERRYVSDEIAARRDVVLLGTLNATLTRGDGTQYVFNRSGGYLYEVRNKVGQRRELATDAAQGNRPRRLRAILTTAEIGFVYDRDGLLDFLTDAQISSGTPRYVDFTYDAQRRLTRITQPVMFTGSEYPWNPSSITAPLGSATGIAVDRSIPRTAPIGLLRITAGTISAGRSEDLVLRLISPSGTEATIYDQVPDPAQTRSLAGLSTLTSAFEGENPNGTWRLVVISRAAVGELRITSFALRFSDPSNPTVYTYDSAHRLTSASDPIGPILANMYDTAGRVVTQDDGRTDNQLLRLSYDERPDDTLVTTVTDREGHTSSFLHDRRYRILRWTDGLGQAINYTSDASGNRLTRTSTLGHVTRFAYDARHNLTSATDPAGKTTIFQYDANRNLLVVHDARGTETRFGYDARNNQTTVTDFLGRTTTRTYSANSQLGSVTLPDGGKIDLGYAGDNTINFVSHPTNSSQGTRVVYDGQGRVTRRTPPDGNGTDFAYSPTGKLLRELAPDGRTKDYTFDARDRLLSESDLLGQTTRYQYDGNDNVVVVTNALGQTTRSTFDGEDRLIRTVDALGQTRATAYDAAGQVVSRTDGLGQTTRYRYDADGNLTSEEDPDGVTVARYGYTARAELERESGAYDHPTLSTYDEMGNLATATDPAGRRLAYTYDPLNRHVTLTDAANRISRQTFDADGQIESITGPGGGTTAFAYDRANRLSVATYGPRTINYTYNERDRLTQVRDGGRRFDFDYDSLGRRIRTRVYAPGGTTVERTITYTLDANGHVLSTADSGDGRSVSRQLDPLERPANFTDASGRQVGYSYDTAGRLIRLTYPGGRAVNYTYDTADQLIEVADWSNRRTRFAYDRAGRVTRIEFPNATYRTLSYDRASRPTARSDHEPGGAVICAYRYEYALDGRLESAVRTDIAQSYRPATVTMTFDDANRVTAYNGTALTSELGGGLTRIPTAAGFPAVAYDTRGRVRTIGATTFNYDPEDRLTGWSEAAGTTSLFVDPHAGLSRVLERATPDGNTTRYVHGLGLLYEETGTAIRVYHYDDQGSTIALTDNTGRVTQRFAYGPYGEEIGATGASGATPFRFLGLYGVMTEPNGTCSMRSRFYSPALRRFISEDFYPGELASPNSLNRYAYAHGDPVSFDDPDGEFINIAIGAIAGAIGGVVGQGVSDLINNRKPNWKNYVSAAAGGAVTGALIGSGVGVIVAGGAGGLTENFLNQSLNGALTGERDFDFAQLGIATGTGALTGAITGGSVRGVNGATGTAFRKQVVRNGVLYSSKRAALRAPVADVVKRTAIAVGLKAVKGPVARILKDKLRLTPVQGDLLGSADAGIPPSTSTRTRFEEIRGFVGQGQRSQQGPLLHFSLYETWLSAALVPLPNSPTNARRIFKPPGTRPMNPAHRAPTRLRFPFGRRAFSAALLALAPVVATAQTFSYDAAGRLLRAVWADGQGVAYAYDDAGNIVQVLPVTAPAAPGNIAASSASATSIDLTWQDNATDETGYTVQRRRADSDTWQPLATLSTGASSYRDASVVTGVEYLYRVQATGTDGPSAYSGSTSALATKPATPPVFSTQPASRNATAGTSISFTAAVASETTATFQWQRNGTDLAGTTSPTLTIDNLQPSHAGLYHAVVANSAGSTASQPAILGLLAAGKTIGAASEIAANILHPNGNTFDQVLLEGAAAAFTADSSLNQITRLSFIDLTNDIVQVEFSGPGTVSIVLDNSSGPALPANYNQAVSYMKGHAGIVVSGANETTNLSVFSVGRANAVNQALFRDNVTYDGFADLAFIAIQSVNGKFGGVRTANASYFATRGLTGIYAPGVEFTGPVFVGDISASDAATPVLVLGSASDVRITGGDMQQANNRAVQVNGIAQLKFAAGSTSHGSLLPAQTNKARFEQNGVDVTAQIVVNPVP